MLVAIDTKVCRRAAKQLPSCSQPHHGGLWWRCVLVIYSSGLADFVHEDDVSALVLDIGAHTVRAGYAGDDSPKSVFPTAYGYRDDTILPTVEGGQPTITRKVWVGDHGPPLWKPGQEVGSPFHEGMRECSLVARTQSMLISFPVTDFTYVPNIIDHAFKESLRCDPADHPVLVTEPAWNTPANRERMAEILFEESKVPAFYIANSGVLTA